MNKHKSCLIVFTLVISLLIGITSNIQAATIPNDNTQSLIAVLQNLIKALMQMITQLQQQLVRTGTTGTTVTTGITPITTSTERSAEYCLDWDFFATNKYKDGQAYEEIKRIQEKLGVEPVGGHYGPQTQAAIEAFNRKYGTYLRGCCGHGDDYTAITQGTIAKFNELYCNKFYTVKIKTINTNNTNCPSEKRAEIIPQVQYPDSSLIEVPLTKK